MDKPAGAPASARRHARAGLTAVELLVALTLAGVLMGLAAPSFLDLSRANRHASLATQLAADLMLGRSEAIRRGSTVSVCVSPNGAQCQSAGTDWMSGWIVYADTNANRVVDSGEAVLRVQRAPGSGSQFFSDGRTAAFTFDRQGFAAHPDAAVVLAVDVAPTASPGRKCVVVSRAGQAAVLGLNQTAYLVTCT